MVENVKMFDSFQHPKTGRKSEAYRINYRHFDRSLTNEEVDRVQEQVRRQLVSKFGVDLR